VDEITVESGEGAGWAVKVVRKDAKSGLALLRVQGDDVKLKPLALADAFSPGAVSCVSFPSVNIFDPAPERLDGGAGVPKDEGWTVRLSRHPRLPGGPLIAGGKVVGVELASRDSELGQIPAVTLDELREFIRDHLPEPPPARAVTDPTAATMQLTAVSETIE